MLYITVKLFGKTGIHGEFKAYEAKALALFRKHGGEVVAAYAPLPDKSHGETPDEIQILKIESRADFEGFLNDPERVEMVAERDAVIRKTELFLSGEIILY